MLRAAAAGGAQGSVFAGAERFGEPHAAASAAAANSNGIRISAINRGDAARAFGGLPGFDG